jgi:sulfite reductase (NADPH) flavoprotein alpha-component
MQLSPHIPQNAPFTESQRKWLNSFFGEMFQQLSAQGGELMKSVTVLFASQTGNAENLAKKLGKFLKQKNIEPRIVDIAKYEGKSLEKEENIVIITSTYGDGDPPDSAKDFHQWLHSEAAPNLSNVKYSVLALGDSSYPDFCKCGVEFDLRLEQLGAKRMISRVDCDVEFDQEFGEWSRTIAGILSSDSTIKEENIEEEKEEGWSKKTPFSASVLRSYNLHGENSEKTTRHIEISLAGSGLTYEVGDALGVYPQNSATLVDEIIALLSLNSEYLVADKSGEQMTLRDALISQYDIRTLTKPFIEKWCEKSNSSQLSELIKSDDKKVLADFIWGRELIDLIIDYPAKFSEEGDFLSVLRKLQPRLYSISSSHRMHSDEVHLSVGLVNYESHGRQRGGVCSNFLARRNLDESVKIYIHENNAFRLPANDDLPMIMVGPGTGIAPFRAFIEERKVRNAKGENWLFFGNPYQASDFLYQGELDQFLAKGNLAKLSTAFSRDQKEKIYVQDRMREQGKDLWDWLEKGAAFYVCGDASRMAKDVDQALHDVISRHGKMSSDEAAVYVSQMKKNKRYLRDVY